MRFGLLNTTNFPCAESLAFDSPESKLASSSSGKATFRDPLLDLSPASRSEYERWNPCCSAPDSRILLIFLYPPR